MFQSLDSKLRFNEIPNNDASGVMDKLFLKELFSNLKNILILVLSMLVASCKMSSLATPFGIAMLGAISLIEMPLIIPFILVGTVTGVVLGEMALLKFIISGILYVAIKSFVKNQNTKTGNAGIILFSCMMAEIVGLSIKGLLLYDALFGVYNSIMSAVFFLIFSEGLPVIYSFDKQKINGSESLICVGVILSVALSAIGEVGIWGVTIRGVVSILSVMLLGWKYGVTVGATSGLSISFILGIIGYGNVATVATYAFCGMLSGILSKFGKVGVIIGFVLGNIVLVFFANGSTEVLISIKEIIVASAFLFFIPKSLLIVIDNLFDYNKTLDGEGVAGYIEESTIYKLGAVSNVINDIAENVSSEREVVTTTDEIGSFIKTLNENTCKRCENYNSCWKQNYHKMYEQTFNAIEVLQVRGEVTENDLTDSVCVRKDLFAEGLNLSYEIYKVNKDWQERVKEQRIQMAMQLKEVSKELNKVKENISANMSYNGKEIDSDKPLNLEFGIAKIKKYNSTISGDSNTVIKLKDGKILVALSDGMGSGDVAARNSKKVVLNFEKLLNTGFEEDRAVRLINSYMLVGKDVDNFATIDAMIFEPNGGLAEFIKIGACPTFICNRNSDMCVIDSNNLPVGLLGDIEIETNTKLLRRGDVVVMVSDGVLDADFDKKDQAIVDLMKAVRTTSAQRLADIMLQEAIDCNFGMPKDDMTVIVARVL